MRVKGFSGQSFSALGLFLLLSVAPVASPHAAVPCGVGTFSATGMEPCEPAPLGHFVNTIGATFATAAPAGFYVDTVGAVSPKLSPAGYATAGIGEILPGAVSAGTSQSSLGQITGNPCVPGTASRGGAAVCIAVPGGVPAALGPEFNSTIANGTGGSTYFGPLDINEVTSETSLLTFDFTVTNEAVDYGLEGDALSSDLTLVSAVFRGDDPGLFQLDGFTPGMVLGEGESANFTLRIDPFFSNIFNIYLKDEIMTELTFRTDQGNQRGFDPLALGFDAAGIEAKYAQFRDAGGPAELNGGTRNLSREFTFEFRASISEPSMLGLMAVAVAGVAFCRARSQA